MQEVIVETYFDGEKENVDDIARTLFDANKITDQANLIFDH